MTYVCDESDCVGGEVEMFEDGIVPTCWGYVGDEPHPMTILDELFPEDAPLPPRTTEYRMYSEDRGA